MSLLDAVLALPLGALVLAGLGYTLAAAEMTRRALRAGSRGSRAAPSVSLLKPLHGADPGLFEALESFCLQDYPGEVEIVFGVHQISDPAVRVVEALRAAHPQMSIKLVADEADHGANRKVSNLINIAREATNAILVISDADIVVPRHYLRRLLDALNQPGAGAVSCLYVGRVHDGAGARLPATLSAMGIDYQFLPGVAVGRALGLAEPCFGSTIALDRRILDQIGGFEAIADHLADDYEIGRRVRALGLRLAIPPMVVEHICAEASLGEWFSHELRWARTVRQIDPVGHAGSVLTHVLPLALLSALAAGFPLWSLGLVLASLLVRIILKIRVDASTGGRAGPLWLLPLRDILSFGVFLGSFAVNTVGWRGQRFKVDAHGALRED